MDLTNFQIKIKCKPMYDLIALMKESYQLINLVKEGEITFEDPSDEEDYMYYEFENIHDFYHGLFPNYLEYFKSSNNKELISKYQSDIKLLEELQINVQTFIESTTSIVYVHTNSFDYESLSSYEDIYKYLYPNENDYDIFEWGFHIETRKYNKKNGNFWTKIHELEMDYSEPEPENGNDDDYEEDEV